MFWVFSKMSPTKLDILSKPIDLDVDIEARTGHVRVSGSYRSEEHPRRSGPISREAAG